MHCFQLSVAVQLFNNATENSVSPRWVETMSAASIARHWWVMAVSDEWCEMMMWSSLTMQLVMKSWRRWRGDIHRVTLLCIHRADCGGALFCNEINTQMWHRSAARQRTQLQWRCKVAVHCIAAKAAAYDVSDFLITSHEYEKHLLAKKLCDLIEPPSMQLRKRRPRVIFSRRWVIDLSGPYQKIPENLKRQPNVL